MSSFSFLGAEKVVLLNNQNTFTAEYMYSEWKEWVVADDNAKYEKAFDTTGGDSVGGNQEIAPYFFLRNNSGWRIKMPAQNGELVLSGNLFPRDPSQPMFIQADGYDAFLRLEVSTRAVVIRVGEGEGGVAGLTEEQNEKLDDLHKLGGLSQGSPATFTPTSIEVGDISLTITGDGSSSSIVNRNA